VLKAIDYYAMTLGKPPDRAGLVSFVEGLIIALPVVKVYPVLGAFFGFLTIFRRSLIRFTYSFFFKCSSSQLGWYATPTPGNRSRKSSVLPSIVDSIFFLPRIDFG
jgi:hypothetical protein